MSRNIFFGPCAMNTALGDLQQSMDAMLDYRDGLEESQSYGMIVGEMRQKPQIKGYTSLESLIINQMETVMKKSGLSLSEPCVRFILSTTKGNIGLLEGRTEDVPKDAFIYETAEKIARHFHSATPPIAISNACISGVSALITGRRLILAGECSHVIVVGCDVLSEFITTGFASFKSISGRRCRPYDAQRDGLNLGEACGTIVLTSERDKAEAPYLRIEGGSVSNDANHISGPSRTGDGLYFAIKQAMDEAGVRADDIGLVNTHGTATVYNDEMESKALSLAGLSETPTNSLKGYIGHTLGASGVVETIVCLEELRRGTVLATRGYSEPGTPCPVNASAEHRALEKRRCVKTASGFGGCNAAIVIAADEYGDKGAESAVVARAKTTAEYCMGESTLSFAELIREEYRKLSDPNMKFFKMSDLCKAAYIAVENLMRHSPLGEKYRKEEIGVILANSSASLDTDIEHQRILEKRLPEGTSPAVFVYTLPSVAGGEICIRNKFMGDNTFFIDQNPDFAESYARMLIEWGYLKAAVCGWCEKMLEDWDVRMKVLEAEDGNYGDGR